MVAFLAPLLGIAGTVASAAIASNAQKKANEQSIAASQAAQNLSYDQTLALQNLAFAQNKELAAQAQGFNKELYDYTTPDLVAYRDRALAAGFNPLSVMGLATGQAGGMSGGGVSGGQIAPVVPQLSSQSFLADAVRDSTDIFMREVNAQREFERRQIERREDFERELELSKSFNTPQGTAGYSLAEVKPPKLRDNGPGIMPGEPKPIFELRTDLDGTVYPVPVADMGDFDQWLNAPAGAAARMVLDQETRDRLDYGADYKRPVLAPIPKVPRSTGGKAAFYRSRSQR